jgi:hypothetical protein
MLIALFVVYSRLVIMSDLKGFTMKYLLLLFLSSSVFAQDFHTYKLFNNEFEAVFPAQPSVYDTGFKNNPKYIYNDKANGIMYTSTSIPTTLNNENYHSAYDSKEQLDDIFKEILTAANEKLISFSSTIDKKKSTYIAIYTSYYFEEDHVIYTSTKRFIYKSKHYSWKVMSADNSGKHIFDKYRKYSTVIK